NEPLRGRALELTQACFQDCHEVTFTTIVFGNELDVNEVSRFLPGDWEEEKEKRLSNFQLAFDILPKHRIPLVQNIQKLATEAQQFLSEAIELFEITNSTNETHVPCTMDGEQASLVRSINRIHSEERLWKNVASYLELVFPYHLGSLFKLLKMELDTEFRLQKRHVRETAEEGTVDAYVKQLFENHYRTLLDARTVSKLLTPNLAADYEKFTRRLTALLRKTQFESVPKVFEYLNYDIDLRQFENLYR
uniref:Uncharacterized protein n=1 Tax=Panagrolaimus sp. ES5 TaxID=591445 RepID=A0AC34F7I8_9BILA